MSRQSRTVLVLASVSLVACASAEFRPRAVGSAFTGMAAEAELLAEGRMNFRGGNFALAVGSFRRALRQNPQSLEAHNGLAASYDRLGRFDLAQRYYEEGLALAPADPRLRTNYAISLRMQGREQEAAQLESESAYLAGGPAPVDPPARQALAELGPSDEVTIVLPPPAPVAPPRVDLPLPRLERVSTAEIALITRPDPDRGRAREAERRPVHAEARALPARVVRDTAHEVVIEIGAPPTPPMRVAVAAPPPVHLAAAVPPPAAAGPVAPATVDVRPAPAPTRPVRAAILPAFAANAAPGARTGALPAGPTAVAATASGSASPIAPARSTSAPIPRAIAQGRPAEPTVQAMTAPAAAAAAPAARTTAPERPAAVAARVSGTVSPAPVRAAPAATIVLQMPAAAPVLLASAPERAAPTTRPPSASVGVRATGTVRATPSAFTPYTLFSPLRVASRGESWQPLAATPRPAPQRLAGAQGRLPMRILNAVGRRGQAARMQAHLSGLGWSRSSIGDARSRRIRSILLTPPGTLRQAQLLAGSLPFRPRLIRTTANRPLLLVLGRDAVTFDDGLQRGARPS